MTLFTLGVEFLPLFHSMYLHYSVFEFAAHQGEFYNSEMLGLFPWIIFPAAPLKASHNSEPVCGMTHDILFFLSHIYSPIYLPHGPLLLKSQWPTPVVSHHSPCALCPIVPQTPSRKGQVSRRRSDVSLNWLPGFLLIRSKSPVWDTVAAVHVHLFPLVWTSRKDSAHWSQKIFTNQIMSV